MLPLIKRQNERKNVSCVAEFEFVSRAYHHIQLIRVLSKSKRISVISKSPILAMGGKLTHIFYLASIFQLELAHLRLEQSELDIKVGDYRMWSRSVLLHANTSSK